MNKRDQKAIFGMTFDLWGWKVISVFVACIALTGFILFAHS